MPKAVRSIVALEVERELLAAAGTGDRTAQAARRLDRQREAGHLELTLDVGPSSASPEISVERKRTSGLRSASKKSGESRCGRMFSSSIVIDLDRDAALERDLVARDDELGVDGLEAAAKDGDAGVVDFEVGVGVDRVDRPGAVCDLNVAERCCGHLRAPLLMIGELQLQ